MNKLYLNGIYKAKSSDLISLDSFDNLKKLNGEEFIDYLKEISYVSGDNKFTIEDSFAYQANNLKDEINQLSNNKLFSNIFYLNNDLTNIKIAYKSTKFDIPVESVDHLSKYSLEALIEFFKHDNKSLIEEDDLEILSLIKDINEVSMKKSLEKLEKLYFEYYYNQVKNFDNSLKLYLEYKMFVNNLKLFLKLKHRNSNIELLKELLMVESFINIDQWLELFESTNDQVISYFNNNFYGKLKDGVASYFNERTLSLLNENLNEYLDELLLNTSFNSKELGSVTYYMYLKELEMKKLRRLYYE